MKITLIRRLAFVGAALLLYSLPAVAQTGAAGGGRGGGVVMHELRINTNVANATVFIDEVEQELKAPNVYRVQPGRRVIEVRAAGYNNWIETVLVSGPDTLPVNLDPVTYSLTVTSNVASAMVAVNGNNVGRVPVTRQFTGGNYSVRVTATGYVDFNTTVNLGKNEAVNAVMEQIRHTLRVNANVSGATVFINNGSVGNAPHSATYTPGQYSVRVTAPGYIDFNTTVTLGGNQTVNAVLQPATGRVSVVFPNNTANVVFFVNDTRYQVNARDGSTAVDLPPGEYRIRFVAGGIDSGVTTVRVQSGSVTTLRPNLGFQVQTQ